MHTEPLGKGWEIYWFQVFKDIPVQSLADHLLNQAEASLSTYDKKNKDFAILVQESH